MVRALESSPDASEHRFLWVRSMSVGTSVPTRTAREEAYASFVIISGVVVYLIAISFVNTTTANMLALSSKSRERVAAVEQFLHRSAVPHAMRERVLHCAWARFQLTPLET